MRWIIGTIIAFIAAGGGWVAWIEYFTPQEIELSHSKLNLEVGENKQVKIYYKGTQKLAKKIDVEWSTNKPSVASVKNGSITAHRIGEATVKANSGEFELPIKIIIKKNIVVSSVEISPNYVELHVGERTQLHVAQKDIDGENTKKPVNWSSDDPSIASVSDGYITANNTGRVKIFAKVQDAKNSSGIKVLPLPIDLCIENSLSKVSLNTNDAQIYIYFHTDRQQKCAEMLKKLIRDYKEIRINKSNIYPSSTIVRHYSKNKHISKNAITIAQTLEKLGFSVKPDYYRQGPIEALKTKNNLYEVYFAKNE